MRGKHDTQNVAFEKHIYKKMTVATRRAATLAFMHGACTKTTRHGTVNMHNRKPYRTKRLKEQAKAEAEVHNGAYYAGHVPTFEHSAPSARAYSGAD